MPCHLRLPRATAVAALATLLLTGCAPADEETAAAAPEPRADRTSAPQAPATSPATSTQPAPTPSATAVAVQREPRRSFVSIPRIGMVDMPVERYRGTPDDAPGTELQNTGIMASPRGSGSFGGTVGPGQVGNHVITGHRSSHGAPLLDLPDVVDGDRIRVRTGDQVFVYRVTGTRVTSFRSPRSLRQQSAAVPGRPGAAPTEAMLTLSTCRTPEDRAEGNFWSDEFGNPENRIDKIAVLERVRPVEE